MISTEIGSIGFHLSYERAIEEVARAGFDGFDLSMFDMARYDWSNRTVTHRIYPQSQAERLKFVRALRRTAENNGIVCNQAHAPFPSYLPEIAEYLPAALECAAEAGATVCVVHPFNSGSTEENAEFFHSLLPYAHDFGVKIATENMFNWDPDNDHSLPASCSSSSSFTELIAAVNDPMLVACLDIGHAEMREANGGEGAPAMIRALGSSLQALHIHDNDRRYDRHRIPFSTAIDFSAVAAALKEVGYRGWYTLEADTHLSDCRNDEETVAGIRELAAAARRFEALCAE